MDKYTINVTKWHIKKASKYLSNKNIQSPYTKFITGKYCPIVQAVKNQISKDVEVTPIKLKINKIWYILPIEAQLFIQKFDMNGEGKPFKFTIEKTV